MMDHYHVCVNCDEMILCQLDMDCWVFKRVGEGPDVTCDECAEGPFKEKEEDVRYPYTYAADYLREVVGSHPSDACPPGSSLLGLRLSRGDAALIQAIVAEALGMRKEELSVKLADAYIQKLSESSSSAMDPQEWQRFLQPG